MAPGLAHPYPCQAIDAEYAVIGVAVASSKNASASLEQEHERPHILADVFPFFGCGHKIQD